MGREGTSQDVKQLGNYHHIGDEGKQEAMKTSKGIKRSDQDTILERSRSYYGDIHHLY